MLNIKMLISPLFRLGHVTDHTDTGMGRECLVVECRAGPQYYLEMEVWY